MCQASSLAPVWASGRFLATLHTVTLCSRHTLVIVNGAAVGVFTQGRLCRHCWKMQFTL